MVGVGLLLLPAKAASIDVGTTDIDGQQASFITVDGELEYGDETRFADLAIGLPDAMVFFSSPGGNLHAGIEIGKAIRLKGFATMALERYSCASACALAWLGGIHRFMATDYAVGFHAATVVNDPLKQADSVGNALVGAYLNQIGISPAAIAYMTEAQPQGMRWLSFEDARAVGIEVSALSPEVEEQAERNPVYGKDDWASYGEWIQIFSRTDLGEAIDLGRVYRRDLGGTFIFRYDNGWYVVVLGPYPAGTARGERDRLVRSGRIPRDSLVNPGIRFEELVWGAEFPQPSVASRQSPEEDALAAAREFFASTSESPAEALGYLGSVYPPLVDYYGKRTAKVDVMREKTEFVARWPQRLYVLRDGADVACRPDGSCVVDGLVDWRTYSAPRNATSTGTARFILVFKRRDGALTILSEASTVLTRQVRRGR